MSRKSQISMEYMMVVGFSLLMVIPIISIYGMERVNMRQEVNIKQAQNIANKLADSAETVYYLGKPTKTTLKVYMPEDIESVTINGRTILFKMRYSKEITDVPPPLLSINVTGNLSIKPGIQYIEVAADDNGANITTAGG